MPVVVSPSRERCPILHCLGSFVREELDMDISVRCVNDGAVAELCLRSIFLNNLFTSYTLQKAYRNGCYDVLLHRLFIEHVTAGRPFTIIFGCEWLDIGEDVEAVSAMSTRDLN